MKTEWTSESLRGFEHNLALLFEEKKINCPLHLSGGNEAQLIKLFEKIGEADWVFSTHRAHYHYLLKGGEPQVLLDEILGLPGGMCGGKGRSMHLCDVHKKFYSSAIVAGCVAIACGVGLSIKKRAKATTSDEVKEHVWCFVGDGAEDSGHFIEAVRFGISRQLPVTFVIEDNDFSIDSTKKDRWHNYFPVKGSNILRYEYVRTLPHCGIGKWVAF